MNDTIQGSMKERLRSASQERKFPTSRLWDLINRYHKNKKERIYSARGTLKSRQRAEEWGLFESCVHHFG